MMDSPSGLSHAHSLHVSGVLGPAVVQQRSLKPCPLVSAILHSKVPQLGNVVSLAMIATFAMVVATASVVAGQEYTAAASMLNTGPLHRAPQHNSQVLGMQTSSVPSACPDVVGGNCDPVPAVPASAEGFINHLYSCIDGRSADSSGYSFWLNNFNTVNASGTTKPDVVGIYKAFYSLPDANGVVMPEFDNRNLSNNDFVANLYRCVYFRNPDAGGFAFFLGQLNNATSSRANIKHAFLDTVDANGNPANNPEFIAKVPVLQNLRSTATAALQITNSAMPEGMVGQNYSYPFQATGGTAPYTWQTYSTTFPCCIATFINNGTNVYSNSASGLALIAGTWQVGVQVTDSQGATTQKLFTWKVNPSTQPFVGSQSSFNFQYKAGDPAPAIQTATYTNQTNANIALNINVPNKPNWLAIHYETSALIATPGVPITISVAVNPSGLSAGTYSSALNISGNFTGSPLVVPITFTVTGSTTASQLTVTSPHQGDQWQMGSHHPITWTSSNIPSTSNINISLKPSCGPGVYCTDAYHPTIKIDTVPNSGSYDWKIESNVLAGYYSVVLTLVTDTTVSANSPLFAVIPAPVMDPVVNQKPTGFLDHVDDAACPHSACGWSFDPDNTSASNYVHFYLKDSSGRQVLLGATQTNQLRTDVNSAHNVTGNHGFTWPIPATYVDGSVVPNGSYQLYAYGIDVTEPIHNNECLHLNSPGAGCRGLPYTVGTTTLPVSVVFPTTAKQFVTDLYVGGLNRQPEDPSFSDPNSGPNFWLKNFNTTGDVAGLFTEFMGTTGHYRPDITSNADYVKVMYNWVYFRDPDQGGLNYWTSRMSGAGAMSRQQILQAFLTEREFNVSEGGYQAVKDRLSALRNH